jgi:hypothetical protein
LPTPATRQRRFEDNTVSFGQIPSLRRIGADLFDPANRFVSRNDRQLAAVEFVLAAILVIVGAAEAIGLDPQQAVIGSDFR